MSKKYRFPFETYRLGRFKPSTIELDKDGLGRYQQLTNNPIYYENILKFCGGDLYRAALGYEKMWDRKTERKLMLCLDYFLTDLRDREQYYLEELTVTKPLKLHGVKWFRGIAPQDLTFDLQWVYELKPGESITARINLLDKPFHVDIEQSDGSIHTIPYLKYRKYLFSHLKPKRKETRKHAKPAHSAPTGTRFQSSKRKSFSLARCLIEADHTRKISR